MASNPLQLTLSQVDLDSIRAFCEGRGKEGRVAKAPLSRLLDDHAAALRALGDNAYREPEEEEEE